MKNKYLSQICHPERSRRTTNQNIGMSEGHPIVDKYSTRINIPKNSVIISIFSGWRNRINSSLMSLINIPKSCASRKLSGEVLYKLNKSNCHPERSRRTTLQRQLMLGLFFIGTIILSSCSFVPKKQVPIKESELPISFSNGNTQIFTKEEIAPIRWWETFQNEELNDIVNKVLEKNLDLKIAISRMDMMESQFKVARGARLPSVSVSGSAAKQEGPVSAMSVTPTGISQTVSTQESESYSLRTGLRFELDIWGKLRAQHKAAVESYKASKADLETIYSGIISQTILSYYSVQSQIDEVSFSQRKLDLAQHNFNVIEKKYKMGIITKTGFENSKQTLNNLRVKLERDKQTLDNLKNQLAVLMGEFPQLEAKVSSEKSNFRKLVFPKAIPSIVVRNRADIVSANHSMEAARQTAGATFADLFPSISLNGAMNFASMDLDDLFEDISLTKSLSADISQTVFAGGAKVNSYKMQKSQYDQAVFNYKKTVLNAFVDVEDALNGIEIAIMNFDSSEENLNSSRSIYKINKRKYELGAISFNELQQAEQSYLLQKTNMNLAKQGLVAAKIQLHSALGGKWIE